VANELKVDDISHFHAHDLHIPTRTLWMGSLSVDEEGNQSGTDIHMAERLVKNLHVLEIASDKAEDPIVILMENPGGNWDAGMTIYDAIHACKNHVTIVCFGEVMSMGSIILQAADERIMAPNSEMMIHYGEDGFFGDPKSFMNWAKRSERLRTKMEDIYLEKMKEKDGSKNRRHIKALLDEDTILTPELAIELGLADKILVNIKDIY